jgi:hypothetical protein
MRIVTNGVVIAALSMAMVSSALADDKAAAEAEFLRGKKLLKQGKIAEACDALHKSEQLDPQFGTKYNLAECYAKQGKVASAWSIYRDLAQRDTNATRKKDSAKKASALESKLTKLLITTRTKTPGLQVTRGDADVTSLLGIEDPIDPGRYHIVASADGYKPWESDVEVQPGAGATITVDIPPLEIDPAQKKPALPDPKQQQLPDGDDDDDLIIEPEGGGRTKKIVGYSVAGAGVLAIGAGVFFGVKAKSTWADVEELCGSDHQCPEDDFMRGQELTSDARLQGNLSTAFVAVGAVAVGAGVYLLLTAPSDERSDEHAVRLVPQVAGDGVGVLASGSF